MSVTPAAVPLSSPRPRPRLRGWLHAWAFPISLVAGGTLVAVVAPTVGAHAAVPTAVYAVTVSLLFGTSALYHRVTWQPRSRAIMKRLDHSMIFVFIAGTYTPFSVLALPHNTGTVVLAVVWGGAFAGTALKMARPGGSRWVSVPIYLALGWVAVFVLPALLHVGVAILLLILAGGAIYTAGAVVYALRRPDPVPTVFGYHEVFHLCTVVAASCHYVAVWLAVYSG
ncbi:MAG TPA: hemolysin III family protein [Mycobacteriales bacterium]|jgi:channel protein, hemolysin III family